VTQRTYNPLLGDIGRYGAGGEHLFFSQAPAQPAGPENTFDRAMRQLGAVADRREGREGSEAANGMGALPDVPEGNVSDLVTLASGLMPNMDTWQGRLGLAGGLTGLTGAGLVGTAVGRGIDAVRLGDILEDRGIDDNVTMWSWDSPTTQFERALESQREADRGWGFSNIRTYEAPNVDENAPYADYVAPNVDENAPSGGGGGDPFGGHDSSYGSGSSSASDPSDMAKGGVVQMAHGGFVVPADVVSGLGDGSTKAGHRRLGIGQLIEGPGTGMSDDIPANIEGRPEAKVADGEVYLSPEEVERIGKGDHAKGLKRLYDLLDFVREARHGTKEQAPPLSLGDAA
jgi:hypothetical protein